MTPYDCGMVPSVLRRGLLCATVVDQLRGLACPISTQCHNAGGSPLSGGQKRRTGSTVLQGTSVHNVHVLSSFYTACPDTPTLSGNRSGTRGMFSLLQCACAAVGMVAASASVVLAVGCAAPTRPANLMLWSLLSHFLRVTDG